MIDQANNSEQKFIMLVEDDISLQELLKLLLEEELGYKVRMATDGKAALKIFKDEGLQPDLLITDIVMPEMNGRDLVNHLIIIKPDLKVLFMSGFIEQSMSDQELKGKNFHFIAKPFALSEMAATIKSIIS